MIVSVSRRTDIPAIYSDWFFNRLKDREVYIRNPFNRKQISRVKLDRETVDCFVFWTKNPKSMLEKLYLLEGYSYYFQFTLTSYGKNIEVNIPRKKEIIKTFRKLSSKIGKEKVIWRYDPILINPKYTKEYHYKWFDFIASQLSGYTERCVISFVDMYKETRKNMDKLKLKEITEKDMFEIAENLADIAKKYNIEIQSCGEKVDLSSVGVSAGQCIDSKLITKITGKDFSKEKKDNMREGCNCIKSVDIGEYNSCINKCAYCYANFNSSTIDYNYKKHNKNSKLLIGEINGDEKITEHYLSKKKVKKYK